MFEESSAANSPADVDTRRTNLTQSNLVNLYSRLSDLIREECLPTFEERFRELEPYFRKVYELDISHRRFDIMLSGGAAGYLLGRFDEYTDIDIFFAPSRWRGDAMDENREDMEFLLGEMSRQLNFRIGDRIQYLDEEIFTFIHNEILWEI